MIDTKAIPVSVLTGFLGSGKTTILGHLLRQPEFSRTAVIINEFGEIGLDHDLVEASEDSLIELTTGCLCCKVRTDLAETLQDLLRRRDEGRCTPFDRIVIETSGLADPAPILQTLMTDTALAERLVVGSVATTVDAVTGGSTLAHEDVSQKQVAVADRIVLTKLDMAAAGSTLLTRLKSLNSGAPVLTADHGRIAARDLFATGLYDPATKSIDVHGWLADDAHDHSHSHDADIRLLRDRARSADPRRRTDAVSRNARRTLRRQPAAAQGHRRHRREPRPARRDPRCAARLSRTGLARATGRPMIAAAGSW